MLTVSRRRSTAVVLTVAVALAVAVANNKLILILINNINWQLAKTNQEMLNGIFFNQIYDK